MPLQKFLLFPFLVGAVPLISVAQTNAPTATKSHLFAGLGAFVGTYQLPAGLSATVVSPVPVVGVQIQPRLALQVSAAYYQESYAVHNEMFIGANGRPNYQLVNGTNRRRTIPVPMLVRYTLTRRSEHRFQADVLAGITFVSSTLHKEGVSLDSTQAAISTYEYAISSSGTHFTFGTGLRYRTGARLNLTIDWMFNKLINAQSAVPNRLSANLSAGIRYRFGR